MNATAAAVPGVILRPIAEEDGPRLFEIYAASRQNELDQAGLTGERRESFLRMQFDAQHRDYFSKYPGADYSAIVRERKVIGRLYVDRRPDEIRILDIALLPDHQNSGIGQSLLVSLQEEAARSNRALRLHVRQDNTDAQRLYMRLGFRVIRVVAPYSLLEWTTDGSAKQG